VSLCRLLSGLPLLLAVGMASAQDGPRPRSRLGLADPSALISAELGLSRSAAERGSSEALRRAAAPAAVVLGRVPISAERALKGRTETGPAARWEPRAVWESCDAGYAITRGVWRRGDETGEFFALWQRQPKGGWRWLLHEEGPAVPTGSAPEMIAGKVAECAGLPPRPRGFVPPPVNPLDDASRDGSLQWEAVGGTGCALSVKVMAWSGEAMNEVMAWTRPRRWGVCD